MFFDMKLFPWVKTFDDNWQVIRGELENLYKMDNDEFKDWPEIRYYNRGWSTYGLYGWGIRLDKHCDLCPETTRMIETVPGLFNAGFSRMQPKTHIRPHRGFKEGVLRLHVPLIVPDGCIFKVEEETKEWKEGDCFVFDDTLRHEAWNNSDEVRTVLLVDFKAEDLVINKPKRSTGLLAKLLG